MQHLAMATTRVLALSALVVVLASACTREHNDPLLASPSTEAVAATDDTATGTTAAAAPSPDSFGVGDVVQVGDWTYTVHSVTDPFPPTEFSDPEPGNRFFGIDAEVGYNGSDPGQVVSSLVCFDLQDSTNRSFVITLGPSRNNIIDGDVPPGTARRGTIVWEISAESTGLRVNFNCDMFASGQATVNLS